MKKSILAVAGLAAVAGVVAPVAGVFAEDPSLQDTVKITIDSNCTLAYDGTSAHPSGSWDGNTVSATIANSAANTSVGSTKMHIVCNDLTGYDLELTATSLTGENGTTKPIISFSNAKPTAGTSSWGVSNDSGTTWLSSGDKVATSGTATASADVTVTYGAATSSTQAADTYTGTATYTLTHPAD